MIRHFIRLLIHKNLRNNGFYTLINILGLSVGLTVFILFTLFIKEITHYDTFHKNYDSIYRVVEQMKNDDRGDFAGSPAQLGPYLAERIPEIENYVRFDEWQNVLVKKDNEALFESDLLFADNSFFSVFSFEIISGNKEKPIEDISSVVIREEIAKKFFGDNNPIGQILQIGRNGKEYKISAIVEDYPKNSSITFDFILSFEVMEKQSDWGMNNYSTYLLLNQAASVESIQKKINSCCVERSKDNIMKLDLFRLQSLKDMRFEVIRGNSFKTIDPKFIKIFLFATIFILLLASINYINLTTALSLSRSKEVAIKKISGSQRQRIIFELLAESILFALIAFIISIILVELIRPYFENLINETIRLRYSYLPFFILVTALIGIIAGIYPAFFGSQFKIMELLNKSTSKGFKIGRIRNLLVIAQFGISSFLLICAFVFSNQLKHLFNKDLGLETDNIIELQVNWPGIKLNELKNELKAYPGIENVCTSSFTAGEEGWNQSTYWEGMTEDKQINMFVLEVDKDYFETLGIEFIEKINDYKNLASNSGEYYVINQSAKDYIGWNTSIGNKFSVFFGSFGQIAGVTKDFNIRSLHYETSPTALLITDNCIPEKMHIKINPDDKTQVIEIIKNKWREFAPQGAPLVISDLKDEYKKLYTAESKTRKVIALFTFIAIFISIMGLVGLATYTTTQRTKEIGIRKAIGATSGQITFMLVTGFIKWVLIAFTLSVPLSIIYLKSWLQGFAYHIAIQPQIFLITGALIVFIALISVFIQAKNTASKNPIESLRYE